MGKTLSTGLLTNGIWQDASNNIGVGAPASASFKLQVTGATNLTGVLTLGSTISNGTHTYILPSATGTLALVSQIPSIAGLVPTSRVLTINGVSYNLTADASWTIAGGVTSFNTRTGAITLSSGDVTTALGFTPANGSNYLPLVGGTLTGPLTATASSFPAPSFTALGSFSGFGAIQLSDSSNYTLRAGSFLGGMEFMVGGSQRMLILNNGNVGINQANPTFRLDVTGTFRLVTPNRSFFVTSNAYSISDGVLSSGIGMDGDGLYLGNVTSSTGWTIANPQVTIRSNGNIGIGTTSPTFPASRNGMTMRAPTTAGTEFVMLSSTDTGFLGGCLVRNGADFGIVNRTNGNLIFATNAIERMFITSGGIVTRPFQPAFLAYSGGGGFTVTGGGWFNISNALTVESYDIGSNYSGGRFTAPVAGRYFFYAGGWASIGSAANGERYAWSAVVNGGSQTFLTGGNYSLGDTPLSGYSIVYDLNAGDYVDLFVFSAVTGSWGAGTHRVFFGGYLL